MELEHGGRRYTVSGGELVLGADPASGVVLNGVLPRHAAVRRLGERMATIRGLDPGAEVTVNGVRLGPEPTPLLHGDVIVIGTHQLTVLNPAHPAGGPTTPPPGARERLHDTLFGLPRADPPGADPAGPEPAPAGSRTWIVVAAVLSLAVIIYLLLR